MTTSTEAAIRFIATETTNADLDQIFTAVKNRRKQLRALVTVAKIIAAIETATNSVDVMDDNAMQRIGNAAYFLSAAISCERERRA